MTISSFNDVIEHLKCLNIVTISSFRTFQRVLMVFRTFLLLFTTLHLQGQQVLVVFNVDRSARYVHVHFESTFTSYVLIKLV